MKIFIKTLLADSLARRVIAATVLVSAAFSVISSGIQVYWRYQDDIQQLNANFDYIETGFIKSIEKGIWLFSFSQLDIVLDGLSQQSDIAYLGINTASGKKFIRGEISQYDEYLVKKYQLTYTKYNDEVNQLGTMDVYISKLAAKQRLWKNIWVVMTTNVIKTFIVSLCLLILFYFMVGKHLNTIALYVDAKHKRHDNSHMKLNRKYVYKDSLDKIVTALNRLFDTINKSKN